MLPQDSVESFVLLHRADLLSEELLRSMKGMIGFRNVLVHQYKNWMWALGACN